MAGALVRTSTSGRVRGEDAEILELAERGELPERLDLDLAHPLAGEPELAGDLVERERVLPVQAVAPDQDDPLALRQPGERVSQRLVALVVGHDLARIGGVLVGQEVRDRGLAVVADRLVEGHRGPRGRAHGQDLGEREPGLLGHLLVARVAGQPQGERPLGAVDLLQPLDHVDRQPHRARLVGQAAGHRLADPPGGVGRELQVAAPVELLHGADEPDRALLDQIQEAEALAAVPLGDGDHEPQVRLDHAALGRHVAGLDALGQLDLLDLREQGIAPDLVQEALERVRGALEGLTLEGDAGGALRRGSLVAKLDALGLDLPVDVLGRGRVHPGLGQHLHDLTRGQRAPLQAGLDQPLQLGNRLRLVNAECHLPLSVSAVSTETTV